ncbi:MAG: leucine-rich repeat domain-containing protein [Clostridiales bacterium]|nr:leucine-rich repeat domain-containing protein [Clostridiales bacterium]
MLNGVRYEAYVGSGSCNASLYDVDGQEEVIISEPACHYINLEEIVFEDPSDISGAVFYDCTKLKSLCVPKDVNRYPVVRECPAVEITVDADNPYIKVVNNDIYSKNGKTLYSVASTKSEYKVKKTVTEIAANAFYRDDQIKSIVITKNVKSIGADAFRNMKNLTSVKIGKSVKKIGYGVFRQTPKLKTLTFPKNVKSLGGSFGGNTNSSALKKVYINAKSIKKCSLSSIPKTCKIYVKNRTVQKQVRKYGFKGKIILKK